MPAAFLLFWNYSRKIGPLLFLKLCWHIRCWPTQKIWICLFTCMAVRSVHLELVKGLSAELFLDFLRRFIARRGKPAMIIISPQFRLVKTALDQQWMNVFREKEVLSLFSYEQIQWKFITALSPWQGGFYERRQEGIGKGDKSKCAVLGQVKDFTNRGWGYSKYVSLDVWLWQF